MTTAANSDGRCPTKSGKICRLPITFQGVEYDGCIDGGLQGRICPHGDTDQFEPCSDDPAFEDACITGKNS